VAEIENLISMLLMTVAIPKCLDKHGVLCIVPCLKRDKEYKGCHRLSQKCPQGLNSTEEQNVFATQLGPF
jgi:hypothetical protein